jgi:hypothetical protein
VSVPTHVRVRQVKGESVLLNLQSERYFGLDPFGTQMWTTLAGAESIQAAYELLVNEYDVDALLLRKNLEELIERLVGNGLLELSGE